MDGAAVLMHSVRRNSYGWTRPPFDVDERYHPHYGGRGGKYRYRMYAIVDPEASPDDASSKGDCARFLRKLGYGERKVVVTLLSIVDFEQHEHNLTLIFLLHTTFFTR